jgi:hypothetical protein
MVCKSYIWIQFHLHVEDDFCSNIDSKVLYYIVFYIQTWNNISVCVCEIWI